MQKNIFLDLDGTLIDPSQRLYTLFMELVPQASFSFEEYWEIKRNRTNQQDLLSRWFSYAPDEIISFKKAWMEKVEEESRLAMDRPFDGMHSFLSGLSQHHNLYLVTARQNPDFVHMQMSNFDWKPFFKDILVTRQASRKADLIGNTVDISPDGILVGDTGEDVATAKELGLISVAVCSGFLCRKVLEEYQPSYLIDSVLDLHETGLLHS